MNRLQTIHRTPLVHLARFDHPPGTPHRDPKEERAPFYSVNFVERGRFDIQARGRAWPLAAGMAFLTAPGLVYGCRHAEPVPSDTCLSVMYRKNGLDGLPLGEGRASVRGGAGLRVLTRTNRLAYLHLRLARSAIGAADALAVETLAGELLDAILEQPGGRLYDDRQLAWYGERVEAVRAMFERRYPEPLTLAFLGRAVGMSPFHFARIFRQLTGVPPHRYLLRVRLARAAEHLGDGAGVTETCYACGFNNLSHFIRVFRRRFGLSPSGFRG